MNKREPFLRWVWRTNRAMAACFTISLLGLVAVAIYVILLGPGA